MNLGERIRFARKKAGFTQKELAKSIGVDTIIIQQYERNVCKPEMDRLAKITIALRISPEELVPTLYFWCPANRLPPLFDWCALEETGELTRSRRSESQLLWCPGRKDGAPLVVGFYNENESGEGDWVNAVFHEEILFPTYWMKQI